MNRHFQASCASEPVGYLLASVMWYISEYVTELSVLVSRYDIAS